MLNAIKNILSPKGELTGSEFAINYIILRLLFIIENILSLILITSQSTSTVTKILAIAFLLFLFFLELIIIFNYKKRLLNITQNLTISIILAIIFTIGLDILVSTIIFTPFIILVNIIVLPLILSIIPPKNCEDKKEYFKTFAKRILNVIKHPISIIIFVSILLIILINVYSAKKVEKISLIKPSENMEKLVVNELSDYNNMKTLDIFEIRKKYTENSIFKNKNYEPRIEVFGQIQDKKAWWGMNQMLCYADKSLANKGASEESRYINNPNLLVGVHVSQIFKKSSKLGNYCEDKSLWFIPNSLKYDKENKIIIATYKGSKNYFKRIDKRSIRLLLVGLNARDFGYDWAYVNTKNNVVFLPFSLDVKTADKSPTKFEDFIHLGNACGVKGGCNNSSPYQPQFEFVIKNLPADMTVSLWKNKPIYKNQPADMYFKMIFE